MLKKPQKIGFIGTGIMGAGMVHNLLLNEYEVNILAHKNRAPIDRLVSSGATELCFFKGYCTPVGYHNFVLTQFRNRKDSSEKNHFRPGKWYFTD